MKPLRDGTMENFLWSIVRDGRAHYTADLLRRVREFKNDELMDKKCVIKAMGRIRRSGVIPVGMELMGIAQGTRTGYRLVRPLSTE